MDVLSFVMTVMAKFDVRVTSDKINVYFFRAVYNNLCSVNMQFKQFAVVC